MAGLNIIASEGTCVLVSEDGSDGSFKELPGIQSHSESGGDLNQRQVKAFKGVASKLSLPDVSTISIGALYTPTHPAWLLVNKAARAGDTLVWEVFSKYEDIRTVAGATGNVAIAADGVVTLLAATAPDLTLDDFGVGMTLEVLQGAMTKAYTIETINPDTGKPQSSMGRTGRSITTPVGLAWRKVVR